MENETEMTGGFVPIEEVADAIAAEAAAPVQQEGGNNESADSEAVASSAPAAGLTSESFPSASEPLVVELDQPVQSEESASSMSVDDEDMAPTDEAADEEAADPDSSLDFGRLALVAVGFVVGLAIVLALVTLRNRKK